MEQVETQESRVVDGFKRYLRNIFQNSIKEKISVVREKINQNSTQSCSMSK